MKCIIPEISWHNRDPVLSVDIQPRRTKDDQKRGVYRLASGGTDSHVLIWYLTYSETGDLNLDIAADLTRHQRAVNVVRWSPSGELLASGDDESVIFIWKLKSDAETVNILDTANDQDKETWLTHKIMRGHMEDVYDLSWSPNSMLLISGSVDNTAMVWDVSKGKSMGILDDHKSFVQGVAWDPKNQYLATLSTDRHFRVFDVTTRKVVSRSSKCVLPVGEESVIHGKEIRIFHDDTLQTFYRRLSFSPDGELIVTPSGVAELDEEAKPIHTTYVYTRYNTKQPALILPSPDQYTIAVRFCPLLFNLHEHDDDVLPVFDLPYRMVFAVATKSSVYLYDTQQRTPLGLISNIHYTRLTDLSWSTDGSLLIVSSTDGFCTLITFTENELGTVYVDPKQSDAKVPEKECVPKSSLDNELKPVLKQKASTTNKTQLNSFIEGVVCLDQESPGDQSIPVSSNTAAEVETAKLPLPNPIAFRRKPKESIKTTTSMPIEPKVIVINTPEKVIALEIPSGIISTKDKFDSPECINTPVTPIQVRRTPRPKTSTTPSSMETKPGHFDEIGKSSETPAKLTPSPPKALPVKPKSNKKATPIEVRRYQRKTVEPTPVVRLNSAEDAMDAWPIDQPKSHMYSVVDKAVPFVGPSPTTVASVAMDVDESEDIRLVYDDVSQCEDKSPAKNEAPVEDVKSITKTPRRVELRTISTPKSKKKLL